MASHKSTNNAAIKALHHDVDQNERQHNWLVPSVPDFLA